MRWSIAIMVALLAACAGETPIDEDLETFAAPLTADNVVGTDVQVAGSGTSSFTYDGTVLEYSIDVTNMDEITAAHIHGPATRTQNAPIILGLFEPSQATGPISGELVSGVAGANNPLLRSGITLDYVLALIRADSAYVQVHSITYPNGVLRGHIVPD